MKVDYETKYGCPLKIVRKGDFLLGLTFHTSHTTRVTKMWNNSNVLNKCLKLSTYVLLR